MRVGCRGQRGDAGFPDERYGVANWSSDISVTKNSNVEKYVDDTNKCMPDPTVSAKRHEVHAC